MKINVFYFIAESPSKKPSESITEKTWGELERLRSELSILLVSKEEPSQDKIKKIQRNIARLERFEKTQTNPEHKEKDAIGKILANKTSETYLGSDLLSLKKRGIDIATLVLVSEGRADQEISSEKIEKDNIFIVNFGTNTSLNASIGAGDILPSDVLKVRIGKTEGTRNNIPRPGYYDDKGKYLPVFDGTRIEILAKGKQSEDEIKIAGEASEQRWRKLRANDMFDYNDKNPLTDLPEDKSLFSDVTAVAKERGVKKLDTLFSSGEKSKFAVESLVRLGWTKEQSIGIVANLIGESNLNHTVDTGDGGKAYGIAQWHADRQRNFAKTFGKPIQSSSFEEQISFVDWELRNTEQSAGNKLRYASNSSEATDIITRYYERPADKEGDVQKRTQIALQLEKKVT